METTPADLLSRLEYSKTAKFPKATLKEIVARKEEMIPHLIAILESATANPAEYLEGPRVMLPNYAAYLLAQFRETRAYQPLLALLNLEGNLAEGILGDTITEDIFNIVACVFDGDEQPLRCLIENSSANEYARACGGLLSYTALLHAGRFKAEEVERYFQDLLDHKLEREPSHVWNNICRISADLGFADHMPLIRRAFEDDLCDLMFDSLAYIEKRITSGGDPRWSRICQPIDDVVAIMQNWACFNPSTSPRRSASAPDFFQSLQEMQHGYPALPSVPAPPISPRIGRNDPCPCGSGRKFKKCCGAA